MDIAGEERKKGMEEKITVQLTEETLFDFMLYHAYSKPAGFLTNILGAAVGIMGIILFVQGQADALHLVFYLLACVAFIGYTPLLLRYRAKKQMKNREIFRIPWEYTFGEDGIKVVYGSREEVYPWERIEKTVTAPKTIGIYYGKDDAFIIPKGDFKDRFVPILQMVSKKIGAENVHLR